MDALRSLVNRRRILGLAVVGGLLVGALAIYQMAPALPTSAPTPTVHPPRPLATIATTAPTTTSPTPSAPATPPPPLPTGLPPGPGTTEPGILLLVTPNGEKGFDVIEMVRFASPVHLLKLQPPQVTEQWGGSFADAEPRVVEVQASTDGKPLAVPAGEVTRRVVFPVSPGAQTVVLRYRLTGTVVRTVPSTAGRALGAVRPLITGVRDDLRVVVDVSGDGVRNLTCPDRQDADMMCASGTPPQLRTSGDLTWSQSLVIVQLDLPMPR